MKKILTTIIIATLVLGTVSFAQNEKTEKENKNIETINAEDIGIRTIPKEVVEDVNEDVDIETENTVVDEVSVYVEDVENEIPVRTEPAETEEEDTLPEEAEPVEEEDLSEPLEGMFEGYVSGEYLPINYYDCELHDGCYKCEECKLVEEICYDEEINSNGGWYLDKYCIVCGHGNCELIDESEIN